MKKILMLSLALASLGAFSQETNPAISGFESGAPLTMGEFDFRTNGDISVSIVNTDIIDYAIDSETVVLNAEAEMTFLGNENIEYRATGRGKVLLGLGIPLYSRNGNLLGLIANAGVEAHETVEGINGNVLPSAGPKLFFVTRNSSGKLSGRRIFVDGPDSYLFNSEVSRRITNWASLRGNAEATISPNPNSFNVNGGAEFERDSLVFGANAGYKRYEDQMAGPYIGFNVKMLIKKH